MHKLVQDTQRSLAFAPMLSLMMIGVRLRAMQVGVRDPQSWAQVAMYIASFSIVAQVVVSAIVPQQGFDALNVAHKVVFVALLTVTAVARVCLYAAVIALITALFVM